MHAVPSFCLQSTSSCACWLLVKTSGGREGRKVTACAMRRGCQRAGTRNLFAKFPGRLHPILTHARTRLSIIPISLSLVTQRTARPSLSQVLPGERPRVQFCDASSARLWPLRRWQIREGVLGPASVCRESRKEDGRGGCEDGRAGGGVAFSVVWAGKRRRWLSWCRETVFWTRWGMRRARLRRSCGRVGRSEAKVVEQRRIGHSIEEAQLSIVVHVLALSCRSNKGEHACLGESARRSNPRAGCA